MKCQSNSNQYFENYLKGRFAEDLLAWYDDSARILPWRESPEPYKVWVSEIMLQQTQVQTVLPYFERFTQALADIPALAEADEEQLLKLWEGLGYYNRVRNMQRAAKIMIRDHNGKLPEDYDQLLALPGIGAYTAGAIISIAYNKTAAAVDGNVLRVLSRLIGSREDARNPEVKKGFQSLVLSVQPIERPGDFNQALMELGATVCLPNASPLCSVCPVLKGCKAFSGGMVSEIPIKKAKKKRKIEKRTVLIIRAGSQVLLRKRVNHTLLAGLWEPPNFEGWTFEEGVIEAIEELGLDHLSIHRIEQAKHLFTHIEWQLQGYLIEVVKGLPSEGLVWADGKALAKEFPMPSAFKAYKRYLPKGLMHI